MSKSTRWLFSHEAESLSLKVKENEKNRKNARYSIKEEDWEAIQISRMQPNPRKFVETQIKKGKNGQILSTIEKLQSEPINIPEGFEIAKVSTSKSTGQQWVQYLPKKDEEATGIDLVKEFDSIVKKLSKGKHRKIHKEKSKDPKAIKATTTDDHIGLDPNPNNNGLFQYEYSGDIYSKSIDKVFNSILKEFNTYGKFDMLLLDNLGDEADGWGGYTTRGGHKLEQNMSNVEVFNVCVDTKVNLITNIAENNIANKIILRNVTNANHSADFSQIINLAVQKIINRIYSTDFVEIDNLTRFLEHREYGNHCFILTHGKDKDKMFKGFPLILNDKVINQINDYIRFYNIKNDFIHVEKGDLHRLGYEKTSNFDYRNFMSFAPPSSWVQHNFGDCYSGYSIQVVPKYTNEISHTDYFLDYKKVELSA